MIRKKRSRKGKKDQGKTKEEITKNLVIVDDGTTLGSFLDQMKEKGKNKVQDNNMQVKEHKDNVIKPSAKSDFPLFYGRNMPTITLEITSYLQGMSSRMTISKDELEELINEKENLVSK